MIDRVVQVLAAGRLPSSFPRQAFDGRIELKEAQTDEELRTGVRAAEVLFSWQIPDTVPDATPDLRWIQLPSAGADHVRQLPVWQSDIVLTGAQGVHTVPMSEHFFAMLLALTRQITDIVQAQAEHRWIHERRDAPWRLTELRGRTLGIIGWGKIGDGIAHLARAFGMRVIGTRWSVMVPREVGNGGKSAFEAPPMVEPVELQPDIVFPASQLHSVLAQSDVVLLMLPLTAETRGSFGEREFSAMSDGALFFNFGRGAVVDEGALVRALQSRKLAGAGLDVFAHEPLPRSSPLWTMPRVIVSPHVGGISDRTRERTSRLFAVNLARYLDGQNLINVVDRSQGY